MMQFVSRSAGKFNDLMRFAVLSDKISGLGFQIKFGKMNGCRLSAETYFVRQWQKCQACMPSGAYQ